MTICTKFAPQYSVPFMTASEEKTLTKAETNQVFGESILTTYFLLGSMVKNLSMRLIHFIQLSNLWQIGQKKKLIF